MVGRDHGDVVVEDQEEQAGQQDERAAKDSAGELSDKAEDREAEGDAPRLEKPRMHAEEAKAHGVEEICAGRDEFEDVAVEGLSVKDVDGASEEEDLVVVSDERRCGEQKATEIEECRGSGEGEAQMEWGEMAFLARRDFCHSRFNLSLARGQLSGFHLRRFFFFVFGNGCGFGACRCMLGFALRFESFFDFDLAFLLSRLTGEIRRAFVWG